MSSAAYVVDGIGTECVGVQVTKGMDVVKKVEGYGSDSGRTSKKIVISNW